MSLLQLNTLTDSESLLVVTNNHMERYEFLIAFCIPIGKKNIVHGQAQDNQMEHFGVIENKYVEQIYDDIKYFIINSHFAFVYEKKKYIEF